MSKKYRYGKPIEESDLPGTRRRFPQYDQCLKEFLDSGRELWEVNTATLPASDVKIILSSLKWRVRNRPEFSGIRVFSRRNKVFLRIRKDDRKEEQSNR